MHNKNLAHLQQNSIKLVTGFNTLNSFFILLGKQVCLIHQMSDLGLRQLPSVKQHAKNETMKPTITTQINTLHITYKHKHTPVLDFNISGGVSFQIAGRYIEDTIGIQVECNLNLRLSTLGTLDTTELIGKPKYVK